MANNKMVTDIIADVKAAMAVKKAEFEKAALAGKDPASYPGAEHDSPDDQDKTTDAEVNDKKWLPSAVHDTAGGDDSPMTRGHATETGQGITQPEGKEMVTSDANAKTAEQANELLGRIRDYQQAKVAADTSDAPEVPAVAPEAIPAEPLNEEGEKVATGFNMQLSQEVLAKMASYALATEEGTQFMENLISKQAGAEAATEYLNFISDQYAELAKCAAYAAGEEDAVALIQNMEQEYANERSARITKAAEAIKGIVTKKPAAGEVGSTTPVKVKSDVPSDDPEAMVTTKSAEAAVLDEFRKLGQEIADQSIGDIMPPEGMMPEPDPASAGVPEGEFGGGEEDIAAALEQLVAEGVIGPEELEQILVALEAGGEGEGAPMGGEEAALMGGEDPGAEMGLPPEAAGALAGDDKLAAAVEYVQAQLSKGV